MSAYSAVPNRTTSDLNSAADINQLMTNIVCSFGNFVVKTADYVITDTDGYGLILVNPTGKAIAITLPTLADNQGRRLRIKVTHSGGDVTVDGEGAETIDGQASWKLGMQYDFIDVIATASEWVVEHVSAKSDSGYINTNDWSNRHLGSMEITYNNLVSGPFTVGDTITESISSNTWIILSDSGTVLVCKKATGTGFATTGRTLTATSGTTATVNGTTKNLDSNFTHNLNRNIREIFYQLILSTDGTDNNSFDPITSYAAASYGFERYQINSNSFKLQTGDSGLAQLADAGGALTAIGTNDIYYRIISGIIF